jgi:hypothetical protein
MIEQELEELRANGKDPTPEQVDDYNENNRIYRTTCRYCGYQKSGTLAEIRSFFRLCDRLCKHGPPTS